MVGSAMWCAHRASCTWDTHTQPVHTHHLHGVIMVLCAGEAARKRMAELEADNRRARAALAAKAEEVAAAKQRIRQLTQQQAMSPRPQRSPRRLSGGSTPTGGSLRSSRADSSCFASPRGRGAAGSEAGTPRGRGRLSDPGTPCSLSPRSPRPSGQEASPAAAPHPQNAAAPAAQAESDGLTGDGSGSGTVSVSVAAWCSQQLRAYSLQHQLSQEVARLAARKGQLQQQTQQLQEALGHSSSSSTELRQGLEDELDAAAMELDHVGRQLEEAQQQLTGAQQAAEALQAQAGELQEGDVRLLLHRMLQQLVEQSMRNKQTRAQVSRGVLCHSTPIMFLAKSTHAHILLPTCARQHLPSINQPRTWQQLDLMVHFAMCAALQARQLALALQEQREAAASAQDRLALQGWDHQLALTELSRAHEERVAGLLSQAAGTAAPSSSQGSSGSGLAGLAAEGSSSSSRSSGSMGSGAQLSLTASTGRLTEVLGKLLNRPLSGAPAWPNLSRTGSSAGSSSGSSSRAKPAVRFQEPTGAGGGEASQLLSRRCPDLKLASVATSVDAAGEPRTSSSHQAAERPSSSPPPVAAAAAAFKEGLHRAFPQEADLDAAACSSPRPPSPTSCSSPHPSSPAGRGSSSGAPGVTTPPAPRSPGASALRSSSQALQEQLRAYKAHLRQAASSSSGGGGGLGSPGSSRSKPRSPMSGGVRLPGSPLAPCSRQQQGGRLQQDGVGESCTDSDTGPSLQPDNRSPRHASPRQGDAAAAGARKTALAAGMADAGSSAGLGEAGGGGVQDGGLSPALGLRGRAEGDKEGRVRQGLTSRSAYLAALADVAPGPDTGAGQG
jgi:hypothetical protein